MSNYQITEFFYGQDPATAADSAGGSSSVVEVTTPTKALKSISDGSTSTVSISSSGFITAGIPIESTSSVSIDSTINKLIVGSIDVSSVSTTDIEPSVFGTGSVDILSVSSVSISTEAPIPQTPYLYANHVLYDEPIAYWRLGEREIEDPAEDIAGHLITEELTDPDTGETGDVSTIEYYHGEYVGNPELGVPGAIEDDNDTAAHFSDSSTMEASVGISGGLVTVSLWSQSNGDADLLESDDWSITIDGGKAKIDFAPFSLSSLVDVDTGNWHNIVVVIGQRFEIYIDGELDAVLEETPPTWTTNQIIVGGPGDQLIDEVAIYLDELSDEQIKRHYDAGSSGEYAVRRADDTPIAMTEVDMFGYEHEWSSEGKTTERR